MNVSVDVGSNITSLVERLAQQIGVTADKVFPWYVQQAYLEGVTTLVAIVVSWIVLMALLPFFVKGADWNYPNPKMFGAVICFVCLMPATLSIPFGGVESVRQIMNPNYYAMKMLTQDIGRLAGK